MFTQYVSNLTQAYKTLAIKNILHQWLKSINSVCNSGAIVDLSGEDQTTKSYQGQGIEALEWLNKNRTISDRLEGNSSFGVIHRYRTNASTNDSLSLIFFSRTTETLQFQQMLSRIRYHWFRKLSRSPLNAGFERVFDESRNILNINYQPKHMATKECLHVDEIIFNSDLLRDQMDVAEKHCQQFDVTVCKSNLDKCLLAFLDDAFTVKNNQLISKLNATLSPYKVAISLEGVQTKDVQVCQQLQQVVNYLTEQLRPHPYLTVFTDHSITAQKSDELSIPYLVMLNEDTLRTGFLGLRNRDTQIAETIHISNFVKILLFYLLPEALAQLNATTTTTATPKQQSKL